MIDEAIEDYAVAYVFCSYCKADRGEWCVTSGGHPATQLHVYRTWFLQDIWSAGYQEGERDAKYWAEVRSGDRQSS